jgi:hypothetical protein
MLTRFSRTIIVVGVFAAGSTGCIPPAESTPADVATDGTTGPAPDGGVRSDAPAFDVGGADGGSGFAHGDPIVLSGRGFGAHGDYNPARLAWRGATFLNYRFKDMEDGVLNSDGFYPQRSGAPWTPTSAELAIESGGPRGSTRQLARRYGRGEIGGLSADIAGAGNQVYVTFKFMLEPTTQAGKFLRLYGDAPQQDVYLATGCANTTVRAFSECTASRCAPVTDWGRSPGFTPEAWHRVEAWLDAGANEVTVHVDGTLLFTHDDWLAPSLGANGHTLDVPNMIDAPGADRCAEHPGYNGGFHFDDVFVDFTRARVEVGDAPSWSRVSQREVQLPIRWSDGEIAFRFNRGALAPGSQAYVFVVTAAGSVVETGFAFTVR